MMTVPPWMPPPIDGKVASWLQLDVDTRGWELLPTIWDEALELCRPTTWVRTMKCEPFFLELFRYTGESNAVNRLLTGCTDVWLMAATIGEGLECQARALLHRRESFRGYILDRIGSFLIEDLITHLDYAIEEQYRQQGLSTTRRYSPGYRDFSLKAQQLFADLIGTDASLFKVNANHLLTPEKSITALKGCNGNSRFR